MLSQEHCASIIAVPFQLVDQLGDPSYLSAGGGPDVPLLHGGRLTHPQKPMKGQTALDRGRMRPESTASTDRNLHLKSNFNKPVSLPPTRDTK